MSDLYELPNGWEWTSISDAILKTKNLKPKDEGEKNFTYIDIGSINNLIYKIENPKTIKGKEAPSRAKKEVILNDIVYSTTRPNLKNISIVEVEYKNPIASTGFCILRVNDKIINKYLFYYLLTKTYFDQIEHKIRGAQYPAVSDSDVKKSLIPLPPLSEQKRIVSKLDLLFEKIDKSIALHQKNMDEADVFMGSVLNDVFGELEEKYEKDSLTNYCKITSSKRVYKADYVDNGVLFYRIKDIVQMAKNIPITDSQYIKREAFDEFDKKFGSPKSGDILLTAVGATLGYTYLVTDQDGEFYFKDGNLLWMKNIKDLDRKYLLHIFKSPLFDRYLDEISKGAAQPAITIIKLKEFNIPIPPLQIQQKVVNYLDEISQNLEKVKSVQKDKMDSLKALKASILDKAFRGEL